MMSVWGQEKGGVEKMSLVQPPHNVDMLQTTREVVGPRGQGITTLQMNTLKILQREYIGPFILIDFQLDTIRLRILLTTLHINKGSAIALRSIVTYNYM